jgi:hypothetical protein
MFGPTPNSAPPVVRIPTSHVRLRIAMSCSRPPRRSTHSDDRLLPELDRALGDAPSD